MFFELILVIAVAPGASRLPKAGPERKNAAGLEAGSVLSRAEKRARQAVASFAMEVLRRRRMATPTAAKPPIIMAQVAGSGTAEVKESVPE
jgi:hypothetical protein